MQVEEINTVVRTGTSKEEKAVLLTSTGLCLFFPVVQIGEEHSFPVHQLQHRFSVSNEDPFSKQST